MASRREKTSVKRMRKIALVICEGETEVCYINLLKKWYKSPVRIISHIEGTKITQSLVDSRTREVKISAGDKVSTFLMYDMDVPAVNEKILSCKAELLLSNPCIEVWLLLHGKDQKTALSTKAALQELKKSDTVWNSYQKSSFSEPQQAFLKENLETAVKRAKQLKELQNPSSEVYKLVAILQDEG